MRRGIEAGSHLDDISFMGAGGFGRLFRFRQIGSRRRGSGGISKAYSETKKKTERTIFRIGDQVEIEKHTIHDLVDEEDCYSTKGEIIRTWELTSGGSQALARCTRKYRMKKHKGRCEYVQTMTPDDI